MTYLKSNERSIDCEQAIKTSASLFYPALKLCNAIISAHTEHGLDSPSRKTGKTTHDSIATTLIRVINNDQRRIQFFLYLQVNKDCNLLIQPGMCLAYFPSWAYDINKGICRGFVYGGCGGNANRFG